MGTPHAELGADPLKTVAGYGGQKKTGRFKNIISKMAHARHALTLRSEGHRSRSQGYHLQTISVELNCRFRPKMANPFNGNVTITN